MKRLTLLVLVVGMSLIASCSSKEEHTVTTIPPGNRSINFSVMGRVGTVVDDELTNYVQSLNLLTFRKNRQGTYVLYQTMVLTRAQLTALANSAEPVSSGYTTKKNVTIDQLPVGMYRVVGLANALNEGGGALPDVSLVGVTIGNTMDQVIAAVTDGMESPRFFYGVTSPVTLGTEIAETPTLTLNRKVAMFVLTLKEVPEVVNKITLSVENTSGAFNLDGSFLATPVNGVDVSKSYDFTGTRDSVVVMAVSLPTSLESSVSTFSVEFVLDNGQVITSLLPGYALKENTITKLTATINTEKPGDDWKIDLTFDITVNVEWNVDQEPSIII